LVAAAIVVLKLVKIPGMPSGNVDEAVVRGFGDEWTRFDQSELPPKELTELAEAYFRIFPWDSLPPNPVGFDAGCGSGRWARVVSHRVGHLMCVDASDDALQVAKANLYDRPNVTLALGSVQSLPLERDSQDFGYSLGVLHHVPDTAAAITALVTRLKRGAPLLLYLYYAFDNRPAWYRALWLGTDLLRRAVSRLPIGLRYYSSQLLAATVYWPLARTVAALEKAGMQVGNLPLAYYRDRSFYTMRTDALDRFGTRLEQRFTRDEIRAMMMKAGLTDIRFSERPPFWCAVGVKA
jgi:SAM-dependent methyltransferase